MARRTKEEALATRQQLLDAAERVFQCKGVSATTVADIAAEAGLTRGAVYWHFRDKADVFNAMMDRVTLPMEDAVAQARAGAEPVAALREAILTALRRTVEDEQTQRVFEVATHKVEYVDELRSVRERHLCVRGKSVARIKAALQAGAREQGVRLGMPAEDAAHGLHALVDGLIQNWLLDRGGFDLVRAGRRAIDAYLAGLGLRAGA